MLSERSASRETVGSEGSSTCHTLNPESLAQGTGVTLTRFLRNAWKAFNAWKKRYAQRCPQGHMQTLQGGLISFLGSGREGPCEDPHFKYLEQTDTVLIS